MNVFFSPHLLRHLPPHLFCLDCDSGRHWPTWKVQRDIIRPLCLAGGRCRFSELPWVKPHIGEADTFMSHTWGAKWGTLVAAATHGAKMGRFVWIDNMAVRQFPGNIADLGAPNRE